MRSLLVCRYAWRVSTGGTRQGTRSTTSTPACSIASTLSGLFDISRILLNPK